MIDESVLMELFAAFPGSIINSQLEFVADTVAGEWFRLGDCQTRFDVERKVIQYLSRGAYKTSPYGSKSRNAALHDKQRSGINHFLGTRFSPDDIELIYTYLGNGCNAELCGRFIREGYNMGLLVARRAREEADHAE